MLQSKRRNPLADSQMRLTRIALMQCCSVRASSSRIISLRTMKRRPVFIRRSKHNRQTRPLHRRTNSKRKGPRSDSPEAMMNEDFLERYEYTTNEVLLCLVNGKFTKGNLPLPKRVKALRNAWKQRQSKSQKRTQKREDCGETTNALR